MGLSTKLKINQKLIIKYLLSSFIPLVKHIVEHDWLSFLEGVNGKALNQMLLGEPLLPAVRLPLVSREHWVRWHRKFGLEVGFSFAVN